MTQDDIIADELTKNTAKTEFADSDEYILLDYLCYHCRFAQQTKRVDSVADVPSAPRIYDAGGGCSESEDGHQMRLVSVRRESSIINGLSIVPVYEILDAADTDTPDSCNNHK